MLPWTPHSASGLLPTCAPCLPACLPARSGVHECLHMTVAIPLLFGVPPEYERLKAGIKSGGGIIDRVTREWVIY